MIYMAVKQVYSLQSSGWGKVLEHYLGCRKEKCRKKTSSDYLIYKLTLFIKGVFGLLFSLSITSRILQG